MPGTEPRRVGAPTLLGRYRLVRTLEVGERGAIFLAHDLRLHRWRAITVPHDGPSAARLAQEAELLARLEHPALERVIDLGEDGAVSFVVRDRLYGHASDHLPMKPALAAFVVLRLAEGLAHAHSRGILHGHLRPDVVRFADDGAPVLTGFGDAPKVDVSLSGRSTEGWAYLAPEVREHARTSVRSEVYSLGALLYALVSGREQPDLSYAEAYDGILAAIPAALRPLVVRACAYDPAQRPADVDVFRAQLGSRMEQLGSLGELPWRPPKEPAEAPESIVPDQGLSALMVSLGRRPGASDPRAEPVDAPSTMDSEGGKRRAATPYQMPRLHRKDPGFRDPFEEVDASEFPAYVDASDTAGLSMRRPVPLLVDARGSHVGETPKPVQVRKRAPSGPPVWVFVLAAFVGAGSIAAVAAVGAIVVVTNAASDRDRALVDAVFAEQRWAGRFAEEAEDRALVEQAWFAFDDEPTTENARRYVELVGPLAEDLPPGDPARAAIQRMEHALRQWRR